MEDLQRSLSQIASIGGPSTGHEESLYEEVDALSPVKAEATKKSYLSGVGDLMMTTTTTTTSYNTHGIMTLNLHSMNSNSPSQSRRSVSSSRRSSSKYQLQGDEVVEEEVIDDDEVEIVLDQTEVEYYDDDESEIEEIELDDDAYEEIVFMQSNSASASAMSSFNNEKVPPSQSNAAAERSTPRSDDNQTAPTLGEEDDDDDDDEGPAEPLPSRDEVAEAITYIVRQEKVVEYGLLTKQQVEEMNDLPLEEMMEIMKHFEICDNNNATIQWDLVLAMINPDYSPDAHGQEDDAEDGKRKDGRRDSRGECSHPETTASAPPSRSRPLAADDSERDTTTGAGEEEHDVLSEIHAFAGVGHDADAASSQGSSYSLEMADQSEACMSNLTAADADNTLDHEDEYYEETFHGSMVSMDPLIRASYTKSMVELTKSHSHDDDDDNGGDMGLSK